MQAASEKGHKESEGSRNQWEHVRAPTNLTWMISKTTKIQVIGPALLVGAVYDDSGIRNVPTTLLACSRVRIPQYDDATAMLVIKKKRKMVMMTMMAMVMMTMIMLLVMMLMQILLLTCC